MDRGWEWVELDVAGSSPVVEGAKGTVTLLRGGTAAAHDGKKEEHPTNKNKQVKEKKRQRKNPAGIVGERKLGSITQGWWIGGSESTGGGVTQVMNNIQYLGTLNKNMLCFI